MTTSEHWSNRLSQHRWTVPAALLLIVAVGSYFRLADLGLSAFRGDEGFFYGICKSNITVGDIFSKWLELQGLGGQIPFAVAFTKWFVTTFNLPVNHFTVHLPSALWGIVTILAAYGAGRAFAGTGFGLVLALILALNPYHIQLSREAYYYAPLVCGSFLGCWSALWILDHARNRADITLLFYGVTLLGFFLLTYSQPSGWPLALLLSATVVYGLVRTLIRDRNLARPYVVVLIGFFLIGFPMLVTDWGIKQQLQASTDTMREAVRKIFGVTPVLPALWKTITAYGWGDTLLRGSFTGVIVISGLAVCRRRGKSDFKFLLPTVFILIGFGFSYYSMRVRGTPLATRYLVSLLPLYLVVLTAGLVYAPDLLRGTLRLGRPSVWIRATLIGLAVLLWLPPAYYSTQITGKPTPYKVINAWVDSNLPSGTPVLVDRWFEPWCELRDEPSTNVFYTYTVPDEPVDVFKQVNWRATATNFFLQNPDAAYLELTKHYWEDPSVGTWEWPRQHFARHVAFTNEAGLRLRELGLANREDFYAATTNRVIVELFYNRREDALARAKSEGKVFVAFFGAGWSYIKTQDHRGWRVMKDGATIEVYNLSPAPTNALIQISATALESAKTIQIAGQPGCRFEANTLSTCRIQTAAFPPGKTVIPITDEHWSRARVTLLISQLEISVALPPPSDAHPKQTSGDTPGSQP